MRLVEERRTPSPNQIAVSMNAAFALPQMRRCDEPAISLKNWLRARLDGIACS
jgi:hypothetical protein